jgi:hypothetical protein
MGRLYPAYTFDIPLLTSDETYTRSNIRATGKGTGPLIFFQKKPVSNTGLFGLTPLHALWATAVSAILAFSLFFSLPGSRLMILLLREKQPNVSMSISSMISVFLESIPVLVLALPGSRLMILLLREKQPNVSMSISSIAALLKSDLPSLAMLSSLYIILVT